MNKNVLLFIENGLAWAGVVAAFAMAILPIVQVMAGIAAFIFSIMSITKLAKNWYEKD